MKTSQIKLYSLIIICVLSLFSLNAFSQTSCQSFTFGDFQSTQPCQFEYLDYSMTMLEWGFGGGPYCESDIPNDAGEVLNGTILKNIPCGSTIEILDSYSCGCSEARLYSNGNLITSSIHDPLTGILLPTYTIDVDFIDEIFIEDVELSLFQGDPFVNRTISFEICVPTLTLDHNKIGDNGSEELVYYYDNSENFEFDYFGVCADGSNNASMFSLDFASPTGCPENYSLRIKEDPNGSNVDLYGVFSSGILNNGKVEFSYTHPKMLPLNTNKSYKEYTIEIYSNSNPDFVLDEISIRVYRAPVVMIHGLWSSDAAFVEMENNLINSSKYDELLTYRANYKASNAKAFSQNSNVVPNAIEKIIFRLEGNHIVSKKVDVVGHSMGGILTRLYLQSALYNDDISRIITLNTPHAGSQVADLLIDSNYASSSIISFLASFITGPTDEGAIDDLSTGSDAILMGLNGSNINSNIVPSHGIVTQKNPPQYFSTVWTISPASAAVFNFYLDDYNQIFNGESSDLIVAESSQIGGLAQTTNFNNISHTEVTESMAAINQVISLLDTPIDSPDFSNLGYAPQALNYSTPSFTEPSVSRRNSSPTITIANPIDGGVYSDNTPFVIDVNGSSDIEEITVLVSYDIDGTYVSEQTNNTFSLSFPGDTISGARNIIALGKSSSGEIVHDTLTFFVCSGTSVFNDQIIPTGEYYANEVISNGSVEDESDVLFSGSICVELNTGFTIDAGTSFIANTNSCSTSTPITIDVPIDEH